MSVYAIKHNDGTVQELKRNLTKLTHKMSAKEWGR